MLLLIVTVVNFDKAIADCTEAIRFNPSYNAAYFTRARAYFGKHEDDKAIADYTEAIRINPAVEMLSYFNRGTIYKSRNEYDKAIADFTEAIRINSDVAWPYAARGDTHRMKHDYSEAIADYTEAIQIDPRSAGTYRARAEAYLGKNDTKKAEADFVKAKDLEARKTPGSDSSSPFVFAGHTGRVCKIVISHDGTRMASCGADLVIRIWDLVGEKELLQLKGHTGTDITAIDLSMDGRKAVSGGTDKTIRLWDLTTGRQTAKWDCPNLGWGDVIFLPGDRQVLSAGDDHMIRVWETNSGKQVRAMESPSAMVTRFSISPDGQTLLSAGWGDRLGLHLWNLKTGSLDRSLTDQGLWCVCTPLFLPDGRHAISGGYDRVIRLWKLETGEVAMRLSGHTSRIWCMAVSPGGRWAASGACNYNDSPPYTAVRDAIRLWDLESGHEVAKFNMHADQDPWIRSVAFSPDGRYLYAAGDEGPIYRWRLPARMVERVRGGRVPETDSRAATVEKKQPRRHRIPPQSAEVGKELRVAVRDYVPTHWNGNMKFLIQPISNARFPDGAKIHPETGVFTWTPQAAGEYSVTVLIVEREGPRNVGEMLRINVKEAEKTPNTDPQEIPAAVPQPTPPASGRDQANP